MGEQCVIGQKVGTRCPKKKWDILLVIVAVNPTFFSGHLVVVYKEVNVMIKLYNSNVCYCSCMFV